MTKTSIGYFVSRQTQYYSGLNVVEVESNGLDYAGPGMWPKAYRDEMQSYKDPRQAIESAIRIRDAWIADGAQVAGITVGTTGGMGMEPEVFEGDDAALIAWAEARYQDLPKCDQCGELREETFFLPEYGEDFGQYCSDGCCDDARREQYAASHIDEWRENAVVALLRLNKERLAKMLLDLLGGAPVTLAHIMRRYRKGRLVRVLVNKMSEREIQSWGEEDYGLKFF